VALNMAVVIDVAKVAVNKVRDKLYSIVLKLIVIDGEVELINENFSQYYRTGDVPAIVVNRFCVSMQAGISDYIEAQNIYNAVALDNAIEDLEGGLTWQ
jgi:hypothetical protein